MMFSLRAMSLAYQVFSEQDYGKAHYLLRARMYLLAAKLAEQQVEAITATTATEKELQKHQLKNKRSGATN